MRPAHFISATVAAFWLALVWCIGTASAQNMIGFNSNYDGAVITYLLAAVDGKIELAGSEVCLGQLDHQYSQPTATTLRHVPLG